MNMTFAPTNAIADTTLALALGRLLAVGLVLATALAFAALL